jgi:hypothetical protein
MITVDSCHYTTNRLIFEAAYKHRRAHLPKHYSEEAYFGLNNPVRVKIVALMEKIHAKYETQMQKSQGRVLKEFVNAILGDIEKIQDIVVEEFNVEKCQIGLLKELDAFSIPMCWDTRIVGKSDSAKKARLSLNDIVETTQGFRYKTPDKKYLIIGLGLRFFDPKMGYTAEEITAILLHEIGHSFQNMLFGIQAEMSYKMLNEALIQTYKNLKFGSGIVSSVLTLNIPGLIYHILGPIFAIFSSIKVAGLKNDIKKTRGVKKGTQMLDRMSERDTIDRKEVAEKNFPKAVQESTIKKSTKKMRTEFWMKTAIGFRSFFLGLLSPVLFILDAPANIFLMLQTRILHKTRYQEEFADMFATFYGLGTELASGLARLGARYHRADYGLLTFLNYVPLLNLTTAVWHYHEMNINATLQGYPELKKRIAGVYAGLRYELSHNKDLDDATKREIEAQMKETEAVYNEFVFGKGIKNFIYKVWNSVIRSTIEKDANTTSVEANVLQTIEENKKNIDE